MTKSTNGPSVQIATTDAELVEIERFRYSVYIDEMHKPLPWADHRERRLPDAEDHDALHTYIRGDAEVVACARLHIGRVPHVAMEQLGIGGIVSALPPPVFFMSKLMVGTTLRGSIHARALMAQQFQYAVQRGGLVGFCTCRPELVQYYRRVGLFRFGEPCVDEFVGRQIPLVILNDAIHFDRAGSYLASIAREHPGDAASLLSLQHEFLVKRHPLRELREAA